MNKITQKQTILLVHTDRVVLVDITVIHASLSQKRSSKCESPVLLHIVMLQCWVNAVHRNAIHCLLF